MKTLSDKETQMIMKYLIFYLILIFGFISCNTDESIILPEKVVGNGEVETVFIQPDSFYELEVQDEFYITLVQDSSFNIELSAESNIIPHINIYNDGSRLIVKNNDNDEFIANEKIEITIHHIGLDEVFLCAAGSITGENSANHIKYTLSGSTNVNANINCYDFDLIISGACTLNLAGVAQQSYITISGTADIYAESLLFQKSYNTISGIGKLYLNVEKELHATIAGIGNIYYLGDPAIYSNITGQGIVQPKP